MGRSIRGCFVLVGVAALLTAGFAGAEPSPAEIAAARDMFREARQAEDAGDWAGALEKLKAVADVKMTAQVRFHLALCEEQLGFLVEALNDFERATSEAAEQRIGSVVSEAPEHATRIRERLPKLTLSMPMDASNPKVTIDGVSVAAAVLSRSIPINPGSHDIVVSMPGKIYRETISVTEKEVRTLQVVFSAAPVEASSAAPAAAPAPVARPPAAPSSEGRSSGSTAGWIMVGTGGALVLGAGAAALVRSSALSSIDANCPSHQDCPADVRSDQDRAKTFGTVALALGAVGLASAATGVVLVATSRKAKASVAIAPWVTGREAGAAGTVRW